MIPSKGETFFTLYGTFNWFVILQYENLKALIDVALPTAHFLLVVKHEVCKLLRWISVIKDCVKCVQIRSFFLVRIFPHLDWIRRDTKYLYLFSPNSGKYGPEKTPYLETFHAVWGYGIIEWIIRTTSNLFLFRKIYF